MTNTQRWNTVNRIVASVMAALLVLDASFVGGDPGTIAWKLHTVTASLVLIGQAAEAGLDMWLNGEYQPKSRR